MSKHVLRANGQQRPPRKEEGEGFAKEGGGSLVINDLFPVSLSFRSSKRKKKKIVKEPILARQSGYVFLLFQCCVFLNGLFGLYLQGSMEEK